LQQHRNNTRLKMLQLDDNQLRTLPHWLGALIGLQHLSLASNKLRDVPAAVGTMTALTTLVLADNQVSCLPPWLPGIETYRYVPLLIVDAAVSRPPPWIPGDTDHTSFDRFAAPPFLLRVTYPYTRTPQRWRRSRRSTCPGTGSPTRGRSSRSAPASPPYGCRITFSGAHPNAWPKWGAWRC
jgi:hypothetical protein